MGEVRTVKINELFDYNTVYSGKFKGTLKGWKIKLPVVKLRADFQTTKSSVTEKSILKEFDDAMKVEIKKINMIVDTFLGAKDADPKKSGEEILRRLTDHADDVEEYFESLIKKAAVKPEGMIDFEGMDKFAKSFDGAMGAVDDFQTILGKLRADVEGAWGDADGGRGGLDKEELLRSLLRIVGAGSSNLGDCGSTIQKALKSKGPGKGNEQKAKASNDPVQTDKGWMLDKLQDEFDGWSKEVKSVAERIDTVQTMAAQLKGMKAEALPDKFEKYPLPNANVADIKKSAKEIEKVIVEYQKLEKKK